MQLSAWIRDDLLYVQQSGGFSSETRQWMRALSPHWEWDGKTSTWIYPAVPGVIVGLQDVIRRYSASLTASDQVHAIARKVNQTTAQETEVRKLIQKLLDDRTIKMAPYTTASAPTPWWHQQVAWHWAIRVAQMYLALKPGLGKTRIGADIIRGKVERGYVRPPEHIALEARESVVTAGKILPARWGIRGGILITCPRVVLGEWRDQLKRWQNIEAVTITGDADRKRYRAGLRKWVHVCGYDSLESVERNEYDLILADEAHYMANDESNRFKRMMDLRQHAAGALALSGTPIPNMLPSLWAQYYWLDQGRTLGPSPEFYRRTFFMNNGHGDMEESEGTEERVARALSRVTMNMTMWEAFPGKSEHVTEVIRVPMTKEQRAYYEQVRLQQTADVLAGKVTTAQALVKLNKLLQITQGFVFDDTRVVQQFSSAKLKALEEMLTGSGDLTDRKVLVWVRFLPEIEMVEKMLAKHKVECLVLKGNQSDKHRDELKKRWNEDPTVRVFVGMISMGIGINLNAPLCVTSAGKPYRCSAAVFYGLDWKPTQLEQAMDRISRGDQVETCFFRFLLSDDLDNAKKDEEAIKPIDVRVYETLMAKLSQGERVSEESNDFVRRLLDMAS